MKTKFIEERIQAGLCGCYFHVFDEAGEINKQGVILSNVTETIYLATLFSWFDGSPNGSFLYDLAEMKNWTFYLSQKEMIDAYECKYPERGVKSTRSEGGRLF